MDCITAVAQQLTEIRQNAERTNDDHAWASARLYITSYKGMAEELASIGIYPSPQNINKAIRSVEGYKGYGSDWLSHAKKTCDIFPDIFVVNNKNLKLPYHHYREIANSGVPDKNLLREWAEENDATQQQLRERIRHEKDNDASRPDFELKVSNHWRFSNTSVPNLFDGGIHPAIIANLLHYYTDADDVVIDPMAGGGTTAKVVQYYEYFQRQHPEQPFSGKREILMSDIEPTSDNIIRADALERLPFLDNIAKLVILDPPYFGIADGKYQSLGSTISEWRQNIQTIMSNCIRVLCHEGSIAVITDDYNRTDAHHPLASYIMMAALDMKLIPSGTIYNPYPNFIHTMNGAQMKRAKEARVQVNEMKIIHVFQVIK
jgi:hypothetical protein